MTIRKPGARRRFGIELERPDLSNIRDRAMLPRRRSPYWSPLAWGRFIGYSRPLNGDTVWIARYRRKNGLYKQRVLGRADGDVPYFPLGGFSVLQSSALSEAAAALGATPTQVALAWLLARSPNILLIPGTSTLAHLRENLAAAHLTLPKEQFLKLDAVGRVRS